MVSVVVYKAANPKKKYTAVFDNGKKVSFGASGYEDFTTHKDAARKNRYIIRHRKRENHMKSGMYTAGFWSRHLLWNRTSLRASAADIGKRFGIDVVVKPKSLPPQ